MAMFLLHLLCFAGLATAQVGTALAAQLAAQNLTIFKSYLDKYPSFSQQISQGNFTILAPSNDAFLAFNKTATVNQTSSAAIMAALQYHVLVGRHPIMSQVGVPLFGAGDEPQFLPTLLNNPSYTNVSGGQRVEQLFTTQSIFRSGLHLESVVTTTDIAYVEQNGLPGLINVIDKVLTVPGTTIGTLKAGNFTTGYNLATKLPKETSHQNQPADYFTLFIPNDNAHDLSIYTTDYLVALTDYHFFPNYLLYSTEFKNDYTMTSQHGENATMRIIDGDTYINEAKVTATDWLVYNGVLHIIDRSMNFSEPNNLPKPLLAPNGRNSTTTPSAKQAKSDALPIGAKAGIGIVVTLTVLGLLGIAIYVYRRRTGLGREKLINELTGEFKLQKTHELASPDEIVAELNDKSQIVAELPGSMWKPAELDGGAETASLKELDTNERLDVVVSDARSKRRSLEIRMQRKKEQDRIRSDNERENTQTPLDKQELENRRINTDGGVYRTSDHAPQPTSTEEVFGLSVTTKRDGNIVPDTPIDEDSLERIMTPEPAKGSVRPSISMSEGPGSPISPMSSLREGDLSPAPNRRPATTTPTTSPVGDADQGSDSLGSTSVKTGVPEAATKKSGK